jgi:GMP synthase-like glutamine amidotransferase
VTAPPPPSDRGRVLVLQHHPDEGPGALGPLLVAAGLTLDTIELDRGQLIPPLDRFDVMLAMGGPMDVWQEDVHPWLLHEKAAIRHWVEVLGRPFLGVCLGLQLLAAALGGEVAPMRSPEIGVTDIKVTAAGRDDPIFGAFPSVVPGLQWHGAEVALPPADAVVLAANEYCGVQALRVGTCAWGVQFHVEAGPSTVPSWAAVPEYAATLARSCGSAGSLQDDVSLHMDAMARTARVLIRGLVEAAVVIALP